MSYTPDIIEHILPTYEVSILAGPSGGGKSTLIMQFLAAFQRGEAAFLGHKLDQSARWGYLANDHAWKMYEGTAQRAGLDFSALPHISLIDDRSIDLEQFKYNSIATLESQLARLADQGCTAIVVDTLVSWFGGDTRNYNHMVYALIRLGRFCADRRITILGTHHATKARTDFSFKRAQDRISGSSSLLGFSSTQLCLLPPEETGNQNACHQFHIISHNAEEKMIALVKGKEDGLFTPFNSSIQAPAITELDADILNVFYTQSSGVSLSRQLVNTSLIGHTLSASALDRALRGLVRRGLLERARHGEYRVPVPN